MNTCEWKRTYTFPDYYEVSNDGRVRSVRTNKILKPATDKYGYFYYVLCVNGERKTIKAHRLVAMSFIENPDNKPTVDHINGVKKDNRVENLRWATNKEQTNNENTIKKLHEVHMRTDYRSMGMKRNYGRIRTVVYKCGELVGDFESMREASEHTGVSIGKVSQCMSGLKSSCKGFVFTKRRFPEDDEV